MAQNLIMLLAKEKFYFQVFCMQTHCPYLPKNVLTVLQQHVFSLFDFL